MEEFNELTEMMRKTPSVQPPDDFTPRVMAAVMQAEPQLYARALNFLIQRREFTLNPVQALRGQSNYNEMYLYFILIAAAHLAFAFVLLIGLQNINIKTLLPPIILLQPWLLLFLSCWLGLVGLLLKKNIVTGVKVARITALIYIEAVVINGVLLFIQFSHVLLLIPFIATIIGGAFAAGVFLALICGNNNIKINNSRNASPV
jgi:hypothetical protein